MHFARYCLKVNAVVIENAHMAVPTSRLDKVFCISDFSSGLQGLVGWDDVHRPDRT